MTHHTVHRRPPAAPLRGRALAALTAGALLACSSGTTAPNGNNGPPRASKTVDATPSLAFSPASLTVTAGDTVTFAFGSVAHNVFFDTQAGAPDNITGSNAGVSVTRVFPVAGTYRYTCHIHPFMSGTVVVQSGGTTTNQPGY